MKNYDQWNNLKKQLEERKEMPSFHEGDVWWCSLGVNIGQEIDGKNACRETSLHREEIRPFQLFRAAAFLKHKRHRVSVSLSHYI